MKQKRRYSLLLIISLVVLISCEKEKPDNRTLFEKLNDLPGVSAISIEPVYGYPEQFRLEITQPLDHAYPDGASFTQEAFLHHRGEELPMVFAPAGYGISARSHYELGEILEANILLVTHRYFVDAEPDLPQSEWDWDLLNISQAAADHHRVVEMFQEIYEGPWVSTGASKSGQTALFHRRFYPEDVDATVAYVAPIVFGTKDARFIPFMENVGTAACRSAQNSFERQLLLARDSLLPRFVEWFEANNYDFSLDPDEAYEYAVLEYHFSFWQFHDTPCEDIPDETATLDEMFDHFVDVLWINFFADPYLYYYTPYYYQALKESGYPSYITAHLEDLLQFATDPGAGFFVFADVELPVYNPAVVEEIDHWLRTEGDNIIYIYGEIDPWSAAMFDTGNEDGSVPGTNSFRVIQPGEDHGVRIGDLDEQGRVLDSLEVWLDE